MTSHDSNPTISLAGKMLRAPEEIARLLNSLVTRGEPIISDLDGGKRLFRSRLRFVDPARTYIIIEPGADEAANEALLVRPRVTFHAEPDGWRLEFAAADPMRTLPNEGAPGIRLRFPEIVSGHQRRADERAAAPQRQALRCIVDEKGVMPLEGVIANVSKGGIGFFQYDPAVSLEPGTVLKGCRIESTGGDSVVVDMEVRYSQLESLADGTQVQSSGCRFLNLSVEEAEWINQFFGLNS